MRTSPGESDNKLRELILHIASASESDDKFGAVKLNKLLFYADFYAYLRFGRSITGQEYFAIEEGPAPRRLVPVREFMVDNRELAIQKIDVGLSKPKHRPVALRDANYSLFTAAEVALVDGVIEQFKDKTGTDLTNLSHNFSGWQIAFAQGEKSTIPYSSARFDVKNLCDMEVPPPPAKLAEQLQAA